MESKLAEHVVISPVSGKPSFRGEEDYRHFLKLIGMKTREKRTIIHAYSILPDKVSLLLTCFFDDVELLLYEVIGKYNEYLDQKYSNSELELSYDAVTSSVLSQLELVQAIHDVEFQPIYQYMTTSLTDYLWSSYRKKSLIDFELV